MSEVTSELRPRYKGMCAEPVSALYMSRDRRVLIPLAGFRMSVNLR